MAFFQLVTVTLAVQLRVASADLPVHCLRHQVAGDWEFTLGPTEGKRSSCGHKNPDDQFGQPPMNFLQGMGPIAKRRITLSNPNIASSEDGNTGTWTMIYDEGFEVDIGDLSFFAFSKFEFRGEDGRSNNVSHCDQTQIGWYRDTMRSRWGCYFGRKITSEQEDSLERDPPLVVPSSFSTPDVAPAEATTSRPKRLQSLSWLSSQLLPSSLEQEANDIGSEQATTAAPSLDNPYEEPPEYTPWVPSSAGYDKPMPSTWQRSVADALNFLQLGWKATTYHVFTGKTPRELNKFAGVRRHRPQSHRTRKLHFGKEPSFSSFLGIRSKVRHTVWSHPNDSFDWRSKDGQNWLEPVVSQGDCGSCYTISTVHMLTARNRIRKNSLREPSFSISFPLYCSEYNQGCDGGYGFLQSKWSEDVGLVPKRCLPFSTGGGSCQVTSDCDLGEKRYRATNHHYVGGFYGGAEAELIRQELVKNGPLVMSFEPKEDFMYYKSGVYKSSPNKIHQEWEQVDHAVLLTGYGAEKNGQPFWSLQNSWGRDWGEDGYFRMARGSDESGCESIVVSADVVEEASNPVLDDFIASL
mmetsp:Transcript_6488/g.11043  ORF Transcript_6488/g.11043 Transcript_6488/m.11043 type:complete len:579 (+) Transcript_6488:195-1931(+)